MRPAGFKVLGLLMVAGALVRPAAATAGPLPDRFTLGRCVPADCWMYVHAATNPDRAWIAEQWSEVFEELKKSAIDRDVVTLIMSVLSEEERAEARATIDKVTALIEGVNWSDLVDREFVFAERPAASMLGFDYIAIVQGKPGSGEANAAGLAAILKEVAQATDSMMKTSKVHDAEVWELSHVKGDKIGVSVNLFRREDTIGLVTSRKSLEDIVAMLAGKSEAKPLIATPRFQEAMGLVEPPADSLAFFDIKAFMASLSNMFENIAVKSAHNHATPDPQMIADKTRAMAIFQKIIARVDVFDYSVASVATRDNREMTWQAMRMQPGKEDAPLASAILNRKPFEKFDRFIPAQATGFSMTGLVDLGMLYDIVLDFVRKDLPNGEQHLQRYQSFLAGTGFDPKRDVFDWCAGEMISVDMPPAIVTPMGGSDSVLMIRVKDPALARAKLDSFIGFVKSKLKEQGQMLTISPAKVNGDGFREITHPSIAMLIKPVVGIHDEWLVVGSSCAAVNKCLDVASGKIPSILKNEQFREEGLIPKGPVRCASFKDTSKTGQELGAAVGMIGMFGGMAVAGMPETTKDERQGKEVMKSLLSILMKLAPALQKIDFYSSSSSMGTYDGKLTIRTESVVTYKLPKEAAANAQRK